MALRRNWLGQKRVTCDGCGVSSPPWKAVGWMASYDCRRTYHPDCPKRGSGSFRPLVVVGQ